MAGGPTQFGSRCGSFFALGKRCFRSLIGVFLNIFITILRVAILVTHPSSSRTVLKPSLFLVEQCRARSSVRITWWRFFPARVYCSPGASASDAVVMDLSSKDPLSSSTIPIRRFGRINFPGRKSEQVRSALGGSMPPRNRLPPFFTTLPVFCFAVYAGASRIPCFIFCFFERFRCCLRGCVARSVLSDILVTSAPPLWTASTTSRWSILHLPPGRR